MSQNAILIAIIKAALLCLLVIGGIGLVFMFWVIPYQVRAPEVAVPNLVGQSYPRAVQLINRAGLQQDSAVEKEPSPNFPEGHVIEQEPPANFKVKLNKPVRLTLSMGSEMIAVPDVAGQFLKDAETALRNTGFRRQHVAAVHSDRYSEINTVIAQTPWAGTMHQRGTPVNLLLSLGVRSKVLRMPDLRRMPIDEVRSLLESHGLRIGEESVQPHPEINEGLIISHDPPAGELIPIGQVVNLEISGSRRVQTDRLHSIPIKYRVSSSDALNTLVRIVVDDEQEKHTEVVNDLYQPGMLIEIPPLRVFGKAIMRIYEDNKLIKTEEFDW